MTWFWTHGQELFVLFLFPMTGLGLEFLIGRKKTICILISSCILLTPALTSYSYIIPLIQQFLALIGLSCIYSLYSRQIRKISLKITSAVIISGLLFLTLGWFAFMDSFSGSQTVENKWETDGYRIEYVRDQGFSGGSLMKYELSKYSLIPILIKKIEIKIDNDTTQSCNITFVDSKVSFNKCTGRMEKVFTRE